MHVSATAKAVPAAANLTTLGIATNRRHGQGPSARPYEAHRPGAPKRTARTGSQTAPRPAHKGRSLPTRAKITVAWLKQRFVMTPWLAAEES